MRAIRLPEPPLGQDQEWTDESDIAVALFRGAFIIAFALTPYAVGSRLTPDPWTQLVLAVAASFELALLASYLRRSPLFLKRPLALLVDLMMVTSAIRFFEELPSPALAGQFPPLEWLVAVYYPIIIVAAIWYRIIGAILVAVVANVLYGVVGQHLTLTSPMLWLGQAPAMIMVAVAASYIVTARDTERARASRLEYDMSLARRLQGNMFPETLPSVPGLDLGVRFQPARVVGGDFYDAIAIGDQRLLLCVGDMAGKSAYGLVHLSLVHSHIHAAARQDLEPAETADFVNRNVYEALQPNSYAAVFIGAVNTELNTLTFANCGHLPPIVVKGDPEREDLELSTGSIVIGGQREPGYQQRTVALEPGDVVVCYTDGIAEARNRRGEEFGTERIVSIARDNLDASADTLADLIMSATDKFSDNALADDRTVLVLKVAGLPSGEETLS